MLLRFVSILSIYTLHVICMMLSEFTLTNGIKEAQHSTGITLSYRLEQTIIVTCGLYLFYKSLQLSNKLLDYVLSD